MSLAAQETELFPTVPVSAEVFSNNPESAFWIGRIASIGSLGHEAADYVDALGRFRANVYVHERKYMSADVLDALGREFDEYDERSVPFVVIENEHDTNKVPRIVGSIRMITKESPEDLYPIENYFPELFQDGPIGTNSAEVSRFIASYPEDKKLMQHVIALALIRAATLFAVKEEIEDYFCVIERSLYRSLKHIGIPMESLGEPKDVPEQGGILYPIRIKAQEILDSVSVDKTGNIILQDFFRQELGSGGEGYYPIGLVGGKYE